MTTATKITLGFGALIVLLIVSNMVVIWPTQSVDDEIYAMADVGRPRRAATRSIEAGVLSYALAVRTYAQTNDPSHREEAEMAVADVEKNYAEYVRLAATERQRKIGEQFRSRWALVKERGQAILGGSIRFYSNEEWQGLNASRNAVMSLLNDEMLPESLASFEASKAIALSKIRGIQRFVVIFSIFCLIIALVLSQAVGRAIVRSENEIQRRRELLRATLTSIADAVVTVDPDGRITTLNLAAERLTGSTQADAVGKQIGAVVKFIDKTTGNEAESPALLALSDGKFIGPDSVLLATGYGTAIPIEDHAAPILNPKGEVVGNVLVFRDITERKLHEQEMNTIQEDLELRVSHRTLELAETHAELVKEMQSHAIAEKKRIGLLGRIVTGQEDERRRIARDLHDQLGQRLTALRLKLASLKDAVHDDEILTPKIDGLQEIALGLDSEVSYLAWELRPTALDDLGFAAALGAYIQEWSTHFGLAADFQAAKIPKRRLNEQMEIHMYRIAQEALNNVLKHAEAKQVSVVLKRLDERIILIIEDDGKGFVPQKIAVPGNSGRGLGLLGMKERATLIGGEVEVESAPGSGTTIFVRVPLDPPSKREIV